MKPLATQLKMLFESLKKIKEPQSINIKINKLLMAFKPLLGTAPLKQKTILSEDSLAIFLKTFEILDEVGKKQRSENPPDLVFWNALGFGKDEVTNCRILSWFLDPTADHCQGSSFFACLLELDCLKQFSEYSKQRIYVRREEWLDDSNRADIIIHSKDFNIVIEAKIGASEREYQRVDYRNRMKKNHPNKKFIGIFLTSKNNHQEEDKWISITWDNICETINRFTSLENKNRCNNTFVRELAKQYSKYLINNLIR